MKSKLYRAKVKVIIYDLTFLYEGKATVTTGTELAHLSFMSRVPFHHKTEEYSGMFLSWILIKWSKISKGVHGYPWLKFQWSQLIIFVKKEKTDRSWKIQKKSISAYKWKKKKIKKSLKHERFWILLQILLFKNIERCRNKINAKLCAANNYNGVGGGIYFF